jgi:hypothetical protein
VRVAAAGTPKAAHLANPCVGGRVYLGWSDAPREARRSDPTVLLEHAKGVVPDGLRGQVDAALGELRMGQVAAERELADADAPEPGDLPRTPAPPQAEGPTTPGSVEPPGSGSGLWVPGR